MNAILNALARGVCQFAASEDALAHGVAGDRGAGLWVTLAVLYWGEARAVDSRTAAPVAGIRMGGLGLAPQARCGMVRLDPPAAVVRARGSDHGGADHQYRFHAGDGGSCRRA